MSHFTNQRVWYLQLVAGYSNPYVYQYTRNSVERILPHVWRWASSMCHSLYCHP